MYGEGDKIEEGRKVNEVKLGDDRYVDDVLMYKNVKVGEMSDEHCD